MKTIATRVLLATALIFGAVWSHAASITVKGSDTIVVVAQQWAEAYMAKRPDVKIQVTGGGSGIGLAALQNRSTDIANASRKMKPAEIANCVKVFGQRPTEYKVCLDGLSVYVHINPEVDRGETAEYIRWIRGDEGQKVVKEVGYFPLPENQRAK